MGTPEFPLYRIHGIAAASCVCWFTVSFITHIVTYLRWKGYPSLRRAEKLQWCNKVACGLHAAVLVYHQMWNLQDPVLHADPLHAVTQAHFLWASVLFGYLLYDTLYSLLFFSLRSGAAFLVHHIVGLAGCALGLYLNKLALFGMAIEVFFEATTPLLHVLGCMKIARLEQYAAYKLLGIVFIAQFFMFRVVISNYYFVKLAGMVVHSLERPWWAWAGVAVFGVLNALNAFWFTKLLLIAAQKTPPRLVQQNGPSPQTDSKDAGVAAARGGRLHNSVGMPHTKHAPGNNDPEHSSGMLCITAYRGEKQKTA